jgi:hypothetical protein
VIRCDLPETLPELGLLNRDNLAGMTLGAAVLATTRQTRRSEAR